jgi:hypothetical protein
MRVFQANQIGIMASNALHDEGEGKVMGVTSSGAFLRIGDAIVFLTNLPYRSPYNLQVTQTDDLLGLMKPGDTFHVFKRKVSFIAHGITVDTSLAKVWTPGQPVECQSTPSEQQSIVEQLFTQIRALEGEKGFLFLTDGSNLPDSIQNQSIAIASRRLLDTYQNQDLAGITTASESLLGAGGGLTPSGDDFLAGFFLYHLRNSQLLGKKREFTVLALEQIIQRARVKTTTISVNRLQVALGGWSEELFIILLDHIFAPDLIPLPPNFPQALLNFGHSSGVDTLVGIYFAICSLFKDY